MSDPTAVVVVGPPEVVTAAAADPGGLAVGQPGAIEVVVAADGTVEAVVTPPADIRVEVGPGETVEAVVAPPVRVEVMTLLIPGPRGEDGEPGPAGPPGPNQPTYAHVQAAPAAVWVIAHGLGKCPSVTTVDSSGRTVYGDVYYTAPNVVTVVFGAAFSGAAYCN